MIMQILNFIAALLCAVVVLAVEQPTELKIVTTFWPDECPVKAQKGDAIKVHYVRTCQVAVSAS